MRVTVTAFSLSLDSAVEMGCVTPRVLYNDCLARNLHAGTHYDLPVCCRHCACGEECLWQMTVVVVERRKDEEGTLACGSSCLTNWERDGVDGKRRRSSCQCMGAYTTPTSCWLMPGRSRHAPPLSDILVSTAHESGMIQGGQAGTLWLASRCMHRSSRE